MASTQKWTMEIEPAAQRELDKLDQPVVHRILKFLYQRLGELDNPRRIGERLQGTLSEFCKYRVGADCLIGSLEHDQFVVLVLRVGHRKEIYSR
jgi:mRNA interferase RelE/StbE